MGHDCVGIARLAWGIVLGRVSRMYILKLIRPSWWVSQEIPRMRWLVASEVGVKPAPFYHRGNRSSKYYATRLDVMMLPTSIRGTIPARKSCLALICRGEMNIPGCI